MIAAFGNDYIAWEIIVDTQGPAIAPHSNNPNGTRFEETTFYLLEFLVDDDISGVNPSSIDTLIDDSLVEADITFRDETGLLIVLIRASDLQQKEAGAFYKLEIFILDKSGNPGQYTFHFQIGIPVTTTDTNTTPISNTTSIKNPNDSNIFFENIELVIFFALVGTIMLLTYKNYKLRKSRK
ncbi:MAG: hypothetical protein GPJ54_04100 [Candidatus Heimdallarchaeota archaeon]|nr:hypothetical protein [Candidatus Heimdallarchaeota archaeon]